MLPPYPFLNSEKVWINITLLDSETNKELAKRLLKFSRNFSLELVSCLRQQASQEFSYDNFVLTKTAIFEKHCAIEDVVQNATIRCMGEWANRGVIIG